MARKKRGGDIKNSGSDEKKSMFLCIQLILCIKGFITNYRKLLWKSLVCINSNFHNNGNFSQKTIHVKAHPLVLESVHI